MNLTLLLSAGDPLSRDELQGRHSCRLFEHAGKMKRAQRHQASEHLDRYFLRQMLAHIVFDRAELADGQPTAKVGPFPGGIRVFLGDTCVVNLRRELPLHEWLTRHTAEAGAQ